MKKIMDMNPEEIKDELTHRRKWDKINTWTKLIGTSILLIILLVALITRIW